MLFRLFLKSEEGLYMNTELVSLPMQDVTAHGILDEKNRDTLHVQWILTQACNGRCSYCTQWSEMGNTVYVKERVLEIAYKILSDRRPYYTFTFTGGEPTLHPHLTDILAYLYRSHTPLGVVVETNGLRNLDYYKELVEIAPKHTLRLTISAHLEKIALKDLCFLIAMTAEHKQHAHVRLILDPNQRKKVRVFYDTLMKLRAVTPFTLDLWLLTRTENPLELDGRYTETDFSWYEDAQKRFDEINTTSPLSLPPLLPPVIPQFRYLTETKDVAWCDQEDTDLELEFKDFYCCLGTNFLRVSSDGTFQGALCCQARPQQPLWKETSHTSQTLKILQCASPCCVEERNAVLPKFRQKREAEDWVRDFEERRTAQKWEAAPLPHPVHPEPSLEDKVRIRLKRMQPENVSSPQGTPQPETIRQRFTDICTIYAALADEDSKEIFLRRIKFLETGDAGYTLLSAYSAGEHPEMPIYPEDEAFLETGTGYFRLLHLDATTDNLALLTEQEKRIAYYQPKMRIALTAPEWCLDIPLHILEKYKGYTLLIGQHGTEATETWLYAIPPVLPKRYPVIPEELADKLPLVSVIVPTHNNEDTLKRCLDSALIQGIERMELIIIDDASTDKTPEIIAEYVRRYPKIVRTLRFAENKGPGPARNAGMDMAYGQYMTFIDSDDMLAEDFLKRGLEVMEKEDADIVAFDMVMNRDGEEVLWGVEPGTWAGEASLRQFLLKKTGCYGTVCRLYKVKMLREYAIEYADTRIHEDIFFNVKSFYYSKKTVIIQELGYYRYIRKGSLSSSNLGDIKVNIFFDFIEFISAFFESHNLDIRSEMYIYCIRKVYEWDRESIFSTIYDCNKKGKLQDLLTKKNITKLKRSKELIYCILKDYAILYCHYKKLNPKILSKDLDWRKISSLSLPIKTYCAYGNADNPRDFFPILSVIIPNYNKAPYLKKCLDSILIQTMQDFEIIIIDDASNDTSWSILQEYADMYSCIRLYKMNYNNMQGTCRNIGISLARGEYITFIDSDDYIEPYFFELGIKEITKENADIIAFSTQEILPNGILKNIYVTKPFRGSGITACTAYWSNVMPWGPWAKIFNTQFLKDTKEVRFSEGVYHQDVYFMSYATYTSRLCITNSKVVYNIVLSNDSSIRRSAQNYIHIKSYCYLIDLTYKLYLNKMILISLEKILNNIKYDTESRFLPAIAAFWYFTNDIALAESEYSLLVQNDMFLFNMLKEYAEYRKSGPIYEGVLPILPMRINKKYINSKSNIPLISVIVPTYNQEKNIDRCLKSILTQSLRNLEVIIINDASTDKTLDICLAWKKKDLRLQILTNDTNLGQGYSRNRALEIAQGKYITYIDSDNYILPNFFINALAILENNKDIDFIHFSHINIKENGEIIQKRIQKDIKTIGKEALKLFLENKIPCTGPIAKVFKKSFIFNNKIKFSRYLYEDNIFLLKAYYYANNIIFTSEIAYINVVTPHPSSAMNPLSITQRHLNGALALGKDIHNFSIQHPEYDLSKWEASFWHFQRCLSYISSFATTNIFPLTDENMEHLVAAPELLRFIIKDYARLYALHTNYTPALPPEDTDPQSQTGNPATYLIPISFHSTQPNSVIISIIIPAYQVASTLSRCLDSVLNQGMESIEILLIEDCSEGDETLSICEKYAKNFSEIQLFRTPWNSGLGTVRNLALQYAKGTYIIFVDSDDWMAPHFLLQGLPLMQKEPSCEVADFSYYDWDDTTNEMITYNRMPHGLKVDKKIAIDLYGTYKNFGVWAKIYRKDFLLKNNIACGKKFNEDSAFLLKLYSKVKNAFFYDIPSYYYVRKSKTNTIMNPLWRGKKYFESTIENIKTTHEILKEDINDKNKDIYKKRIKAFGHGHHRDNILQYIYNCDIFNMPSPLSNEVLEILILSKDYLRFLIMDYSILSQKKLPTKE